MKNLCEPKKISLENLSNNIKNIEGLYKSKIFINIYKITEKIYVNQFMSNIGNSHEYRFGIANLDIIEFISSHVYKCYIFNNKQEEIENYKKEILLNLINSKYNLLTIPIKKSLGKKLKSKIKYLYENLKYLLFYNKLIKVFHIGSIQLESKHFCYENKLYPIKLDIFDIKLSFDEKGHFNLERKVENILKDLKKEFDFINEKDVSILKKELSEVLISALTYYNSSLNYIKKIKYKNFFLATITGYLPVRNFVSACVSLDYKVYGFCHGFTSVSNQLPVFSSDASLVVTNIVLSSKSYEKKYNHFFKNIPYKIILPKLNFYYKSPYIKIYNNIISKKITNIKNILIISYPKNFRFNIGEFYSNIYTSSKLEENLINFLKKKKIEVFIKSHPDRIIEQKIITDNKCKILDEKFENIYQNYDCAIFIYHRSTAFCFALMTEMPIILIKNELIDLDEFTYQILSKRCSMVSAKNLENDTIDFNENELNLALKEAIYKSQNKEWKVFL